MSLSNDTLKLVTVRPARPFRIGNGLFTSTVTKVALSVATINNCLQEKAFVTEHLAGGREVPLDFNNYNQDNGPTIISPDAKEFIQDDKAVNPEIEMVGIDRERYVINEKEEKNDVPVIHIDLEAEKRKAEEEEAAKAAEEEKARVAAAARAEFERKEKIRKQDEEERQKAIEAIMAREKDKAEKARAQADKLKRVASNSTPLQLSESLNVTAAHTTAAPADDSVIGAVIEIPAAATVKGGTGVEAIDKMSVEELKKAVSDVDWNKEPEYNRPNWDKDDLNVIKSKLATVWKKKTDDKQQESKKVKFDQNQNNGKRK